MFEIILTILILISVFICSEILSNKYKISSDFTRKITHISSGIIIFFTPYYLSRVEVISISLAFAFLLLFTKYFNLIKSIHSVNRKTLGEVYFPIGIALSAALFLPHDILAFQFGVLIMALSDAMAALVGIPWGKHSITVFRGQKSIEGSSAFFLTSLMIWLGFYGQLDYRSLLIPVILTCIEFILILGIDNLILPVAASYLFTVFM